MNDWLEFSSQTSWLPPLFGINRLVKERVYPSVGFEMVLHYLHTFDGSTTADH